MFSSHETRKTGKRKARASRHLFEGIEHRLVLSTFHINPTLDTVAVNLQNGKDASGHISLRSAIMAANAKPNADTIVVPAGKYLLTIPGAGEDNDATGDFDIKGNLTRAQASSGRSVCALGSGTISLNRGPRLVQEKENSNVLHEISLESTIRSSSVQCHACSHHGHYFRPRGQRPGIRDRYAKSVRRASKRSRSIKTRWTNRIRFSRASAPMGDPASPVTSRPRPGRSRQMKSKIVFGTLRDSIPSFGPSMARTRRTRMSPRSGHGVKLTACCSPKA